MKKPKTKTCTVCGITASEEAFPRYRLKCKECCRTQYRSRIYGLKKQEVQDMYEEQGGDCVLGPEGCSGPLHLDHKGKIVRGFLCAEHNKLLGQYEKALRIADKLDDYLEGKLTRFRKSEKGLCSNTNCKRLANSRGFCNEHYKEYLQERRLATSFIARMGYTKK